MTEPRRIALILGNGFDLDLGLKTSYKDFWESDFCPKDYPAPLIRHLNQRWKKGLEAVKWYDLEKELLEYAVNGDKSDVVTEEEREYIKRNSDDELSTKYRFFGTDDVFNNLADKGYLVEEEAFRVGDKAIVNVKTPYREDFAQSAIWRDRQAFKLIKDGLCKYLRRLDYHQTIQTAVSNKSRPSIPVVVLQMAIEAGRRGCGLDIFSFNYTNLLPYIPDHQIMSSWMHYIHGDCDNEDIIIGTRDDVDISEEYDFLYKSFAPSFKAHAIVPALRDAKEIIIFGHSLGENDQQYFKDFFAQQTSYGDTQPKNITIFTKDDNSVVETKRALQKMTNNRLSSLYALNNLKIIKTTGNPTEAEASELESFFEAFEDEYFHDQYIFSRV